MEGILVFAVTFIEEPVVFFEILIAEPVVLVHIIELEDNCSRGQAYAVNNTGELAAINEEAINEIENFLKKCFIGKNLLKYFNYNAIISYCSILGIKIQKIIY
ncbi:hypothetical protein KYB31_01460 [Clostridium felsineum]|uniref:hypothetical protein n=2 Tax=Clostridium felsineum TaxID=36839 RepID=UPI00214D7F53|nr:hypothetical protein [Clostridium felsineum]MCR3757660.1 hypothetical protein [Clostridium felsineum]